MASDRISQRPSQIGLREVLSPDEFAEIRELLTATFGHPISIEEVGRLAALDEPPVRFVIAVDENSAVIGCSHSRLWEDSHQATVWIATHPKRRREGVGRSLFRDVVGYVTKAGAHAADCAIQVENKAALQFAGSLGFEVVADVNQLPPPEGAV